MTTLRSINWIAAALLAAAALAMPPTPAMAAGPTTNPTAAPDLDQAIHHQITATLTTLQSDGNYDQAKAALSNTFEQVIKYASDKQLDLFRDADFALRLVAQLQQVDPDRRKDLLVFLRANDTLAHTLVFLVRSSDKPADVYHVLDRLIQDRNSGANAGQLEKFASLTAALCVVHQRPVVRRINESQTTAPDVLELFDYYSKYEAGMFFGIRGVPAELLTYVVDTTASIDDMKWAAQKYAKDPLIGRHFFDVPYDYASLLKGSPKKIAAVSYSLPNLLKYGGVCADQAYFACSIGKAIGVPTAYTTGSSGAGGHAWVGFLQSDKGGWWNFNMGRYAEYQGVRGNVIEPQSDHSIPDSYVSLLAELIGTKPQNRENAVALTDAAVRLVLLEKHSQQLLANADDSPAFAASKIKRQADTAAALEMIKFALTQNPALAQAWFVVRDLAKLDKLTPEQKKQWSDSLLKLCGQKYPDFALAVLEPMIQSVDDPKEQNRLWNAAFTLFQARSDLAASIRIAQAQMWEAQNQTATAGQCYQDVIDRYANAGPFVLQALAGAEKLLRDSNKTDRVVTLYENTWSRLTPPGKIASPYAAQSNWVQVGVIYMDRLAEAGQQKKAQTVKQQIEASLVIIIPGQ